MENEREYWGKPKMAAEYVSITLDVRVADIDFDACGDGNGTVYGLMRAKYKGEEITGFDDAVDIVLATNAMMDYLGGE